MGGFDGHSDEYYVPITDEMENLFPAIHLPSAESRSRRGVRNSRSAGFGPSGGGGRQCGDLRMVRAATWLNWTRAGVRDESLPLRSHRFRAS